MYKIFLTVFFAILTLAQCTSYEGYKVYKVFPKTETENIILKQLERKIEYDFWAKINKVGNTVILMVAPKVQVEFEKLLSDYKILYEVQIQNVQSLILKEREYHRSKSKYDNKTIVFDKYHRGDEIEAYLKSVTQNYPNLVTIKSIGQSLEKRDMNILIISKNLSAVNPVIFIEAGMHAREWISPAFALYIINQLVENLDNRPLLDGLDWIILPSLNPDGYEYTWSTDRMWRKTRSRGIICDGVDGNRNFGFHWMAAGASDFECDEDYAGVEAFSEVEMRNLRDILASTPNIKAFISLHSYGQYLFYPFSYDNVVPDNWKELDKLARDANDAIAAINGTQYTIGSSTEVLYPAAGCSDDWAMGGAGIKIVYVFELPGGGENGFDLPPSRILPVSIETFEGIKVIANYVVKIVKENTFSNEKE